MSVPRLLVVTAVPYNLSFCQPHITQNMKNTAFKLTFNDNDSKKQQNLKSLDTRPNARTEVSNNRLLKRNSRILKNRMSSQISREKRKLQQSLLEKQLLDLQVEQMKIRLINHNLEIRQDELEKENALLKRLCNDTNPPLPLNEECVTGTLKHASFVNTSLQKKWVLTHLLSIIMITLGDFMNSFQVQHLLNPSLMKMQHFLMKIIRPIISAVHLL